MILCYNGLNRSVRGVFAEIAESTFGISFLGGNGSGRYADVFYVTAQRLSKIFQVNVGYVLDHVMTHELGHLLLGNNAHSQTAGT
jgi:hypothetical protein